jgi:pyrroloquinoline quinone biosynthesis protein B
MFLQEQKSNSAWIFIPYHLFQTKNIMRRRAFIHAFLGSAAGLSTSFISEGFRGSPKALLQKPSQKKGVVVKVLGTAQDGGLPHIGCSCPNCQKAWQDPRFSRLVSSLAVFDLEADKIFLIDATPDIRVQTQMIINMIGPKKTPQRFSPDGVLLTHAHIGHYTGLMFYGYEAQSTDELPVYCSKRMAEFLSTNGPWSQLVSLKNIALRTIEPEKAFLLTPRVSVTAFQVPHRDEYSDTFGFKIKGSQGALLYIPDIRSWEAWDRSVVEEVKKVSDALLDGTFYSADELPSRDLSSIGHPLISHTMQVLKDIAKEGKTRICFTHLNHSNLALDPGGEPRKKIEEQGFHLAWDGMEFTI